MKKWILTSSTVSTKLPNCKIFTHDKKFSTHYLTIHTSKITLPLAVARFAVNRPKEGQTVTAEISQQKGKKFKKDRTMNSSLMNVRGIASHRWDGYSQGGRPLRHIGMSTFPSQVASRFVTSSPRRLAFSSSRVGNEGMMQQTRSSSVTSTNF